MSKILETIIHILTWSLYTSLQHDTLDPISQLHESRNSPTEIRKLLVRFRHTKEREISFVTAAALVCTAVVVGVFSWPEVTETTWFARTIWHCSLWLSIMALINSTLLRMVELLPHTLAEAESWTDEEVRSRLRLVLRCRSQYSRRSCSEGEETNGVDSSTGDVEKSVVLMWAWQSPIMLMSFGWVCFIIGYTAHLVSPLIHGEKWTSECSGAIAALGVGVFACINFVVTSWIGRGAIVQVHEALGQTQRAMQTDLRLEIAEEGKL